MPQKQVPSVLADAEAKAAAVAEAERITSRRTYVEWERWNSVYRARRMSLIHIERHPIERTYCGQYIDRHAAYVDPSRINKEMLCRRCLAFVLIEDLEKE